MILIIVTTLLYYYYCYWRNLRVRAFDNIIIYSIIYIILFNIIVLKFPRQLWTLKVADAPITMYIPTTVNSITSFQRIVYRKVLTIPISNIFFKPPWNCIVTRILHGAPRFVINIKGLGIHGWATMNKFYKLQSIIFNFWCWLQFSNNLSNHLFKSNKRKN